MQSIKLITGCPRLNVAFVIVLLLVVSALIANTRTTPLQEQQPDQPTILMRIQGRLLDHNKKPISDVFLRVYIIWQDVKNETPAGTVGVSPDSKGRMIVSSFKESGPELIVFVQDANHGWAMDRTQEDGSFTIECELTPGTYYLAVDARDRNSIKPEKLSSLNGEPIKFELLAKSPKVDLGDVIVNW